MGQDGHDRGEMIFKLFVRGMFQVFLYRDYRMGLVMADSLVGFLDGT